MSEEEKRTPDILEQGRQETHEIVSHQQTKKETKIRPTEEDGDERWPRSNGREYQEFHHIKEGTSKEDRRKGSSKGQGKARKDGKGGIRLTERRQVVKKK